MRERRVCTFFLGQLFGDCVDAIAEDRRLVKELNEEIFFVDGAGFDLFGYQGEAVLLLKFSYRLASGEGEVLLIKFFVGVLGRGVLVGQDLIHDRGAYLQRDLLCIHESVIAVEKDIFDAVTELVYVELIVEYSDPLRLLVALL